MMEEGTLQERIENAREAFYWDVMRHHIGVIVKIRGKKYFFSADTLVGTGNVPEEYESYPYVLRDGPYNERPENRGKFVRAFKDEFDMMENFKIDGKCLRLLIEDGEVEFIDTDE